MAQIRSSRLAEAVAAGLLAVGLPLQPAQAACSWVDSVTGWNGSLAWSYRHDATWDDPFSQHLEGQTRDQLSATFELGVQGPLAQGLMEGTMATFQHLDITSQVGDPGYTEDQASGPFDARGPQQVWLSLDSFNCTYTFLYGPDPGAQGTSSTKSGCCVNSVPSIVDPGSLGIPPQLPIPALPQPLTFSGQVDALTLPPLPPFTEPYYVPTGPAYNSAEYLGEEQLGKASVQWSFQPEGFAQPPNDLCAGAVPLAGILQDTSSATTTPSDPTPTCGSGDRSVWFLVQVDEAGLASVATAGSDYDTIVSVWPMAQACGSITSQVACGSGTASWSAEPGVTYRVQITRASGGGGGSLMAVATVPEPGAAAWAAGAALAGLARRKRRCSRS